MTYRNAAYHRECFTCTNCTKTLAGQRFTSREELPYCADCFAQLFSKRCNACSKPITGIVYYSIPITSNMILPSAHFLHLLLKKTETQT